MADDGRSKLDYGPALQYLCMTLSFTGPEGRAMLNLARNSGDIGQSCRMRDGRLLTGYYRENLWTFEIEGQRD